MNELLSIGLVGGTALGGVWAYFSTQIHSLRRKRIAYERKQFNSD